MAARRLRWILCVELLLYAALGGGLLTRAGWTGVQVAGLLLAVFTGLRLLIVVVSFGVALSGSGEAPPRRALGPLGAGRMMLDEWLGLTLLFTVIQPFERFWLGPDRLAPALDGRLPLLLIHGYQCNRGFWFWLRPQLEAAGWIVATHSLEPVWGDIDGYVDGIAWRIAEVLAATGAPQVILVGHSMGGLASRAYLRRHGAAKIARLITLGSPHQGSVLARFGWGRNARQMEPGSPWLVALHRERLSIPATAIASCHDNFVRPQASGALSGADNIFVYGIGHLAMGLSPCVLGKLQEALEAPGEATPAPTDSRNVSRA